MGGGDLNSKKSWHPNTMKNQERVWKAEQAAADEKKRILELQHERAAERDRAELNDLIRHSAASSSATDDNRLHWMYNIPDKKVQQEDYLLGKAIDKQYDQHEKSDQDNVIPAVARRVVGSSMLATTGDAQVDLARKIREDPLLLVKERERAARAALLNNPLQRRKLTELLRKDQEQRKEQKDSKKTKKKNKDLDNMLAAKLNALGGEKGLDLATLLNSDDSSSESSSEEEKKRKKKKKKHKLAKKNKKSEKTKKKSKKKMDTDSNSSEEEKSKSSLSHKKKLAKVKKHKSPENKDRLGNTSRKRRSDSFDLDRDDKVKKSKRDASESKYIESKKRHQRESSDEDHRRGGRSPPKYVNRNTEDQRKHNKRGGMSEKERAAKLAEMVAAGSEREQERARRVADQRAAEAVNEKGQHRSRVMARNEAHSLPDSLESRIHSNRHYIQRDRRHMNEHFARR